LQKEREKPETAISGFQDEPQCKPEAQNQHIRSSGNLQVRILKLICIKCRWCKTYFCICQHCWRGQAYCCDHCRRAGYLKLHREAQARYRASKKGKKTRRLAENRRRQKKSTPVSKNVDDGTSNHPRNVPIKTSRQGNLAPFYPNRCHFCGRLGEIVPQFARRRYGNRVYDENFQTT